MRVGGALPIEHRQSPMVPRLSAKHGVGAVLRYLTPSCGGFGFTADGCGFVSSFCLNPKYSKIHLHLPQTGMNARQMLQMLPRYRPPGGLSHVSTVNHPHTLKSRATQSLADFVTQKTKKQSNSKKKCKSWWDANVLLICALQQCFQNWGRKGVFLRASSMCSVFST